MSKTEQVVTATALFLIFTRAKRPRYTQVVTATELPGSLFMRRGGRRTRHTVQVVTATETVRPCWVGGVYGAGRGGGGARVLGLPG